MGWEKLKKRVEELVGKPAAPKALPSLEQQRAAMDEQIEKKADELEALQKKAKPAKPEEAKELEAEVETLKQQLRRAIEVREQFDRHVTAAEKAKASPASDDN
jgi:predicted RNA-binding Zn ribbon-like protein